MENENGAVIPLLVLVIFAFLLLVAKFTEFIARFNRETKYIIKVGLALQVLWHPRSLPTVNLKATVLTLTCVPIAELY